MEARRNATKEECRNTVQRMESWRSIIVEIGKKKGNKNFYCKVIKIKKENVGSELTEAKAQWMHLRLSYSRNSLPRSAPTKSSRTSHTDSAQGEEETPTVEKNWSHKSLEKSWLGEVGESRWHGSESAGWGHFQVSHPRGQGQQTEGEHLQGVLSQHPCIQAKPLMPYQMGRKCLDSGIENNALYSTCGLDTTADPQGFVLRVVLFNTLMSLPIGKGREGI